MKKRHPSLLNALARTFGGIFAWNSFLLRVEFYHRLYVLLCPLFTHASSCCTNRVFRGSINKVWYLFISIILSCYVVAIQSCLQLSLSLRTTHQKNFNYCFVSKAAQTSCIRSLGSDIRQAHTLASGDMALIEQ